MLESLDSLGEIVLKHPNDQALGQCIREYFWYALSIRKRRKMKILKILKLLNTKTK